MKKNKNFTTLDEMLDIRHGKRGTPTREKWEQDFETFRLGVLIEQERKKLGMTQAELAEKIGTKKSFISRVENDAADIRFSTLMKIIQGLGGNLNLTFQV